MKRPEKQEFTDFMLDEAVKYGRHITTPEIETWFETFPTKSVREFKAAWVEYKRSERGQYFPKITDLQRALRASGAGSETKQDQRCTWNGNGQRCRYPVGVFMLGATEGFCIFHRNNYTGPGAQEVCDESQLHTPEEYVERAKRFTYAGKLAPGIVALQERVKRVMAGGKRSFFADLMPERSTGPEADAVDAHIAAADAAHLDEVNRLAAAASEEGYHA